MSPGETLYKLAYQISPIILTGGAASFIPGGLMPIVALTEAANFVTGLLSGGTEASLDSFFCHFMPMPGGTIIDNQVGEYPFANQTVAANAIIAQPLRISMKMICPVKGEGGYVTKLATLIALQTALTNHNATGGTYTIATPAYLYTNCIMTAFRDITSGETRQPQSEWQIDFVQPLLTLSQAASALNSLMSKISSGLPTDLSLSGIASAVGLPPSGIGPSLIPSASTLIGAIVPQPVQVLTEILPGSSSLFP